MRAAVCLTMAGLLVAGAATGERAVAETITEAVEQALNYHPELRRDRALNRAAEHFVDEQYAGYLPTLDFDIASGVEITDSPSTRAAGFRGRELWRTDANGVLSQMVFDGFETQNRVASARFDALASGKTLVATGEEVAREAVLAALAVLEARERLAVAEDDQAELSRVAGLVGRLVDAGRASRVDSDQAASRASFSQAELATAQGDVRTAVARYTEIVGQMPGPLVRPEEPQYPEADDLNAAIVTAMTENPEAQVTSAELDARKADIEVARAPYAPRVDIELRGGYDNNQDGGLGEDNDLAALVRLRWNIFNGFGDLARVRAATFDSNAAAKQDGETRRLIREDVRVAFLALQTARDRLEPLRGDANAARAVYQAYLEQFDVGTRSLLDLLDARNDQTDAELALVTGEYDVLRAHYDLLYAMGRLLKSLGVYVEPGDADRHDLQTAALGTTGIPGALAAAMGDWGTAGTWIGGFQPAVATKLESAGIDDVVAAEQQGEPDLREVKVSFAPAVRSLNQMAETVVKPLTPVVELKRQARIEDLPLPSAAQVDAPAPVLALAPAEQSPTAQADDDDYLVALEKLAETLLRLDGSEERTPGMESLAELPMTQ